MLVFSSFQTSISTRFSFLMKCFINFLWIFLIIQSKAFAIPPQLQHAFSKEIKTQFSAEAREQLDQANETDRQNLLKASNAAIRFMQMMLSGRNCADSYDCWFMNKFDRYVGVSFEEWEKVGSYEGYIKNPNGELLALRQESLIVCPKIVLEKANLNGSNFDFQFKLQKAALTIEKIGDKTEPVLGWQLLGSSQYTHWTLSLNPDLKVIQIDINPKMRITMISTEQWRYSRDLKEKHLGFPIRRGEKPSEEYYKEGLRALNKAAAVCEQ